MTNADERLLALLREARRQIESEKAKALEPIAVVGIACRFPGADGPTELWRLLRDGVDAVRPVPPDRWDADALFDPDSDALGKSYARHGGFLDRIDGFEPEFFGISALEAAGLDPQQRLLLEIAWEALEDSRISPEALRGSKTGVWVGLSLDDYASRSPVATDLRAIHPHNALGTARSVAAGRIAYLFDFHGPVIQLDTACSSSLVAVHLAVQSLRSRECDRALAGGANVLCSPQASVALSRLRALSADGRCKTFDASADGYGRGEGCGLVVLKRLSDVDFSRERVYAVIRGSAINHDGRSNGLTAPSGAAQLEVIRSALESGRVSPADVGYVEAHGTGTLLGDPIEVLALGKAYGAGRADDRPLYVGSIKTNIGHLESAAGVAGLIKAALCLHHGRLVPHLHLKELNPNIPWAKLPVRVARDAAAWPRGSVPRLAGVSAFGLSGTNAHAVLEEAPLSEEPALAPVRSVEPIFLSATTDAALRATAERLREHLRQRPELELGDLALSLATTRSVLKERLALVVSGREALEGALDAVIAGKAPPSAARGSARRASGKLAWLFTGQGAQVAGMGQELYSEWPAFRRALDSAFEALDTHLDRSLREVMWARAGSPEAALLDQTGYTQPALFALEWALAALWRSWGVEPQLLAGHSIGEIVAACFAGVFSLADAARLVCARGRLMQALPAGGTMAEIAAPEEEVVAALLANVGRVSVAAINGPSSTVVSGPEAEVMKIADGFTSRGIRTRRLAVSHAFHSELMDPMLEDFRRVAETLRYDPPRIPIVSNLTGEAAGAEITTAGYWVRQVREAVRFADGIRSLREAGASAFIEIGPRAALTGLVSASLGDGEEIALLPSLRAGRPEAQAALEALGGWFVRGGAVEWDGVFPGGGRRVDLPTYPWQRKRYWVDEAVQTEEEPLFKMEWKEASRDLPSHSGYGFS